MRRRVTQRDIAEAVGVSHVAVSHVLHNPSGTRTKIGADTKAEILRVAQQMGYQPRAVTTHNIAIVVEPQSLWHDLTTNILMAADERLRQLGYRMSVSTLGLDNLQEAEKLFTPKAVDGVIFTEWCSLRASYFSSLQVPWILLADVDHLDGIVDQVALDTEQTAYEVTGFLIAKGHGRICILTGRAGIGYHDRFERGVQQAFKKAKLPGAGLIVVHDDEERGGMDMEEILLPLMRSKKPPTALIASSPGGALVALNRLQRNGYRVPQDVSLVSLIDSPRLLTLRPYITATTAIGAKTVQRAVERLIEKVNYPDSPPQRVLVSGEIIERESVCNKGIRTTSA